MMFNNVFGLLENLGITSQKRALHLQFSNPALNHEVFLQRIEGQHALNEGLSAELFCFSTNALIPLKQFIGCQVAVDQVTDTGQLFRTTGIITQAHQGQCDGSLTLYKLKLEDPSALWKHRRNSRVFMAKSVIEVVQALFKEWQKKSPLFAASLQLDLRGLTQTYDIRPFIMQHNERDIDFIKRLLASESINILIDETQLVVPYSSSPIQPQKFRLIDDNGQYQSLERRTIRFHRSSAVEQSDSITSLVAQRSLQPTSVYINRWQADALDMNEGTGSVPSVHKHSDNYKNQNLGLEDAWNFSPAWIQDLNNEDGVTQSGNTQVEKINQNLLEYHNSQAKQFIAHSTVRDTQVGYWFRLEEHAEIDQHHGADKEFLIIGKSFYNQNNLPKELNKQIEQLIQHSHWQARPDNKHADERQASQLLLQRRNIKIVPEYSLLKHQPAIYPQRAKVVGLEGEEIHVDEWGRIKIRFLFTRPEDHQQDGGAGSNDNDTDSAWVDVLTPWAGEGYGTRFLPRVGEIVVVDFFDGNIDRPFVVGRIHEGQRSPVRFDIKGKLPDTKQLSGIRSKEIKGEGFNQLRFDDSTGQISTQLQSSHAASQLNLGKLSHPKDQTESDDRGEGFELRTDAWGAVRAGQGLLLSTSVQPKAEGDHVDAEVVKQQLESSHGNARALSEVAKNQQTEEIESVEQLKDFAEQIEGKIAKLKKAVLLLSSPNGIAVSSNEDIHLSADGQINQYAGDSVNISTQKNVLIHAMSKISAFAAQLGIKLVAGKGKIEVQAQDDGIDILARKGIQIISTEDVIEIKAAKKIILTGDSSQIEISGSGILNKTGGLFESKAGQHKLESGANVSAFLPMMPKLGGYNIAFDARDKETNEILAFTDYVLVSDSGQLHYGKTDALGKTKTIYSNRPESYTLQILNKMTVTDFSHDEEAE